MSSEKSRKDILLHPEAGDDLHLNHGSVIHIKKVIYGGELEVCYNDDDEIYTTSIIELRRAYMQILKEATSQKTYEEMQQSPEYDELIWTFHYGIVTFRFNQFSNKNTVTIFPVGNLKMIEIELEEFKKIVDPSLRTVEEKINDPWPGDKIETQKYGLIEILERLGDILTVRTVDYQRTVMTMNEFKRRYKSS